MVISEQCIMLSRTKVHFYILNCAFVTLTSLFIFWFDKQSFGFQKCCVDCFCNESEISSCYFRNFVVPDSYKKTFVSLA